MVKTALRPENARRTQTLLRRWPLLVRPPAHVRPAQAQVGLVPLASNTDARLVAGLLRQPLAGPVGVTVPRRARNSNRQERPLLSIPFHTSGAPEGRRARGITPCEGPARRICRRWRRYGRGQEARVRVRDRDRRSRRCGGGSLVDGVASALRAAEAGRPGSVASVEPGSVHSQRCEAGIRGGGAGNSRCRAMERQRALRRTLRERWSRGAPRRRCSRPGEALAGPTASQVSRRGNSPPCTPLPNPTLVAPVSAGLLALPAPP